MKHNKLYAFISHEFNKSLSSSANLQINRFSFKRNLTEINYALYELSTASPTTVNSPQGQSFTLNSHHLSFYEKQKDNDPNLSQYHYTAYLIDSKGTEHQLHVYFDQNDTPKAASLSVAGVSQPVTNDLYDIVVQLAEDKSYSVMKELRAQHVNKLDKLEAIYNDLESKLSVLSSNLATQQDAYQTLHAETQVVIRFLASYHYDEFYEKLVPLFDKISKALKLRSIKAKTEISGSSSIVPVLDAPASALTVPDLKEGSETKKPLRPFVKDAMAAKNRLNSSSSSSSSSALSPVNDILVARQKVADLLMLTEDEGYYASSDDLQQIQYLVMEVNSKAKKLLLNLLMTKKIQEAAPLHTFANPIPEKWVRLALGTGNAPMLDFLLRHGNFAINTFVTSGNLSPVQFCFQKGATHLDCLSVLIKHKASLMCAAQDGLPIAHHLLADTQHPLRKALIDNTKITMGQPGFYKALIRKLESYSSEANINIADQVKLLGAITSYKQAISLLVGCSSQAEQQSLQQRTQITQNIATHQTIKKAMEAITNDPEIQELMMEYQQILAVHNAKLSKATRRQYSKANTNAFKNIEMLLNNLNPGNCSDIKKNVLTFIKDHIEVIGMRSELLDVQNRIILFNRSSTGRTKIPKAIKRDAAREKELVSNINTLESKYSFLGNDAKQNKDDLAITQYFERMKEQVQLLQSSLKSIEELNGVISTLLDGDDLSSLDALNELKTLVGSDEFSKLLDLTLETPSTQPIPQQPTPQADARKKPGSITQSSLIEHSLFNQCVHPESSERLVLEELSDANACTSTVPYGPK